MHFVFLGNVVDLSSVHIIYSNNSFICSFFKGSGYQYLPSKIGLKIGI